ncbi:hypothetical protein BKA62DRAFT_678475 [Auriculariales sp. MPI-PUGE-AT-0066]|nr:hypothetical protein BKA62DRAFT_678475 [Auriculariales sp. MPI-PUGE-AT-0066]
MEDADTDASTESSDDEEEDLGEVIVVSRVRLKAEGARKQHDRHTLAVQEAIRQQACICMGIERKKKGNTTMYSELPPPPLICDNVQPNPDALTMAWTQTPRHPYNRAAADIIAEALFKNPDFKELLGTPAGRASKPLTLQTVSDQMTVSFRTFAKVWKDQHNARAIAVASAQHKDAYHKMLDQARLLHNADHRRDTLLKHRKKVAVRMKRQLWIAILDHIGASSQSSDDDGPNDAYQQIPKLWRHPDLIEFCSILDKLDLVLAAKEVIPKTAFAFRKRLPHPVVGISSTRAPNTKLEKQFYAPEQVKRFGDYHSYPDKKLDLALALLEYVLINLL